MKVYREISLGYFEPWSGAEDNFNRLSWNELQTLESMLEDLYPDGIDETSLNDLFRYDFDTICEWLDIRTEDEIEDEISEKQDEIDSLMEDFESEVNDEDFDEDKDEYFEKYYKDDIDDIKEEIEELKEELSRWQ